MVNSRTRTMMPSSKYTLFEMPLGRTHRDTADYIDMLIWIDIPLDIALARKMREFIGRVLSSKRTDAALEGLHWIHDYLESYLSVVREVLRIQQQKVMPDADLVINAEDGFDTTLAHTVQAIKEHCP